jgi:hypothetical protein
MKQEEEEAVSLLNQAKYLFLRHISEPEENSLRLVVEEAIAEHTQKVSTPDPASPFAEILKGASPIKAVEGAGLSIYGGAATSPISLPKRERDQAAAMRARFTPGSYFGCTPNRIFWNI